MCVNILFLVYVVCFFLLLSLFSLHKLWSFKSRIKYIDALKSNCLYRYFVFSLVSKKKDMSKFRSIFSFRFLFVTFYVDMSVSLFSFCRSTKIISHEREELCASFLVVVFVSKKNVFIVRSIGLSNCMDHIEIHDTCCELDTFEVVGSHHKRMEVAFVDKL